ncbi:probable carboxylesterase 9 [Prosopis cineraria]|uniref:probable carboxylesterase 9 n=1 Tax=Prosopis cineraria TaxID=364024 RepID=UPI00240EBB8C|nr:probable carboxylesterase 9 [Prosopis cineraria]
MSKFDPYNHLSIILNPDGTLTRNYNAPTVNSSPEPTPGDSAVSKDVTLNVEKKSWLRIYRPTKLPSNDNMVARLPIIIYFHHGGWILLSAADVNIHTNCSQLAGDIPAIVVSVNYRLAPESRLPEQYHDANDAVLWVKQQIIDPKGEKWIRDYGDPSRCYLYGCGCGGNIVFNLGMKVSELKLEPLRIQGIIMNQPMFGGVKRTKSELRFATDELLPLPVVDLMWDLVLPKQADRDHRYCNPLLEGPHKEAIGRLAKCLVIGFGGDIMIDRQQDLVIMLVNCGVQVDARFDPVGFHNVDMVDSRRASAVVNIVKEFIL